MHELVSHLTTPLADLATQSRTTPFDAVVLGGGTSGVVSAITLAERGLRVAMIEAGPLLLLTHVNTSDLRFESAQAGQLRQRVEYTPAHGSGGRFGPLVGCLGGRGMFWNGASPRMEPHDFERWPLTLDELEPSYRWAEQQLAVGTGYGDSALGQAMLRRLRGAGMPARLLPFAIDAGATEAGWLRGTIGNAVTILLRSRALWRAEAPLRLAVRGFATRIRFDDQRGRVVGVSITDRDGGGVHEIAARSTVLACGAFESTRLAMASGAPDSSGKLGRGVIDHLFCRTNFQAPLHWYDPERREIALVHVPSEPARRFQLEVHAPAGLLFNAGHARPWRPEANRDYSVMVRSFGAVDPDPENRIEPGAEDVPGSYTVHLRYSAADEERRAAMRAAIAQVGTALDAPAATIEDLPPGRSYHEAGGLPMGRTAADGVTDPTGRFHGCPRLVAADAAAWPTIAASNPHLTIAAHARRAATRLADDLTTGGYP
jgi:choline dehydrogenase-like flavoprotein